VKPTLIVLTLLIAAAPAMAGPREKTYPVDCGRLWAAVRATSVPPHYNYTQLDDAERKGVVSTGSTLSGKRYLQISLSGSGDTCTLSIDGVFSGLAHNDKGDLLKRIDEALIAPAPGPNSEAQARLAVAPARSLVATERASEPSMSLTAAQSTQAGSPAQAQSPSDSGQATVALNTTSQHAGGPAAGSAGTTITLTVTAHCAKDPDPMGFISSNMYSSCKQAELNKLSGWITAELGNRHVSMVSGAENADYRLTVTLTKSMLKAGLTDFSAGTQMYEAHYELVDAAGHAAQNGSVPFQCSGNDRNGEQKFAVKLADTLAGLTTTPLTAEAPVQGPADAVAETGRK
jgi:hypothetical protein